METVKKEITPREAARLLNVSLRTIYDLIESGKVRAKEKRSLTGNRRFWLIPAAEVENLKKKLKSKEGEEADD